MQTLVTLVSTSTYTCIIAKGPRDERFWRCRNGSLHLWGEICVALATRSSVPRILHLFNRDEGRPLLYAHLTLDSRATRREPLSPAVDFNSSRLCCFFVLWADILYL
jgi:hypothetical protein